jgi:hypothetical protein
MIISGTSQNKKLDEFLNIQIIGSIICFFICSAPIPIIFVYNYIYPTFQEVDLEKYLPLIVSIWNFILTYFLKVKISIFFIPCWIVFGMIFILKLFS